MVSDELWAAFEPLIPKPKAKPVPADGKNRGGRPPADDRKCLEGLVYVLRAGCPWHLFPRREFGVGKSTVYDRFTAWAKAGVFRAAHRDLLNRLGMAGLIDASAHVVDSASYRAVFGGYTPGRTRPTGPNVA